MWDSDADVLGVARVSASHGCGGRFHGMPGAGRLWSGGLRPRGGRGQGALGRAREGSESRGRCVQSEGHNSAAQRGVAGQSGAVTC